MPLEKVRQVAIAARAKLPVVSAERDETVQLRGLRRVELGGPLEEAEAQTQSGGEAEAAEARLDRLEDEPARGGVERRARRRPLEDRPGAIVHRVEGHARRFERWWRLRVHGERRQVDDLTLRQSREAEGHRVDVFCGILPDQAVGVGHAAPFVRIVAGDERGRLVWETAVE